MIFLLQKSRFDVLAASITHASRFEVFICTVLAPRTFLNGIDIVTVWKQHGSAKGATSCVKLPSESAQLIPSSMFPSLRLPTPFCSGRVLNIARC